MKGQAPHVVYLREADPGALRDRERRRALAREHEPTPSQMLLGDPRPWQSALGQRERGRGTPPHKGEGKSELTGVALNRSDSGLHVARCRCLLGVIHSPHAASSRNQALRTGSCLPAGKAED